MARPPYFLVTFYLSAEHDVCANMVDLIILYLGSHPYLECFIRHIHLFQFIGNMTSQVPLEIPPLTRKPRL